MKGNGTKGCTVMMRPSRSNVSCWVDGKRCDVVGVLTPHSSKRFSESFAALKELLPCGSCARRLNADVAKLTGLRLGKHERRILLAAPPPDREPSVVSAEGASRSASEVHRQGSRICQRVKIEVFSPAAAEDGYSKRAK